MKLESILDLQADVVAGIVNRFAENNAMLADACFGPDQPTKMIFAPETGFPASLHYMFFPRGSCQQFHWHPGGRHLLVLGDTDLRIRFNNCDERTNPNDGASTRNILRHTLAAVRFEAKVWHEFSAPSESGTGVIAFSFHDTDDLISTSPTLMEELTVFWPGA